MGQIFVFEILVTVVIAIIACIAFIISRKVFEILKEKQSRRALQISAVLFILVCVVFLSSIYYLIFSNWHIGW
jgi:hypothetical protein